MYDGQIFTGILIMEMLYPVCSFIYLYNISKKVTVQFGRFPSMGEKRKTVPGRSSPKEQLHSPKCKVLRPPAGEASFFQSRTMAEDSGTLAPQTG